MTVREPEWSDDDRDLSIALLLEEQSMCPGGCGQPMEISHDPATARTWSPVWTVCQACLVLQAQLENDAKDSSPHRGVLYGVQRSGG